MARRPKKTPMTGSLRLGRELRRLRGSRTQRDIVELSRTLPAVLHVAPLSEAGLSEIESGKSMPMLPTLHALSVIYKVSMTQLMSCIEQERIVQRDEAVESHDEAKERYRHHLMRYDWYEALAIAARQEMHAETELLARGWEANKAQCLARIGLHAEAIEILTRYCELPLGSTLHRALGLYNLACAHRMAGHCWSAMVVAGEALVLTRKCDFPSGAHAELEALRADMASCCRELGLPVDDALLRESLRLLDAAASRRAPDDAVAHALLDVRRILIHLQLGNVLIANRDAAALVRRAEQIGCGSLLARAWGVLGEVTRRQGKPAAAVPHLQTCFALAERAGEVNVAFDAAFALYRILRTERPGKATEMFRHCERLFPRLTSYLISSREFEREARQRMEGRPPSLGLLEDPPARQGAA